MYTKLRLGSAHTTNTSSAFSQSPLPSTAASTTTSTATKHSCLAVSSTCIVAVQHNSPPHAPSCTFAFSTASTSAAKAGAFGPGCGICLHSWAGFHINQPAAFVTASVRHPRFPMHCSCSGKAMRCDTKTRRVTQWAREMCGNDLESVSRSLLCLKLLAPVAGWPPHAPLSTPYACTSEDLKYFLPATKLNHLRLQL